MKPFRLFIGGVGAILIILGVFYTVNTLNFRNNKASRVYLREASSSTTNSHVIKQGTSSAALLFIGDMMFDRYIRLKQATYGDDYVFSCMGDLLAGRDLIIGNLEGPITKASSTSLGSVIGSKENYSFTFPTSTAKLLSRHGITVVNLGNNHTLNKGVQGFASTKAYLRDAGVEYFGGFDEASLVLQKTVKGIPFSFVNYNQFGGSSPEIVSRTIKEEKAKGRIVIVYTHWGDEYTDVTNSVRDKAKLFVARGAC
jgi:poly-gamma-glutamate capsule biosynthesis protein CapA/YwtB (metallophosphatase superfamily)